MSETVIFWVGFVVGVLVCPALAVLSLLSTAAWVRFSDAREDRRLRCDKLWEDDERW